jgi:hypothetical protein
MMMTMMIAFFYQLKDLYSGRLFVYPQKGYSKWNRIQLGKKKMNGHIQDM